MASFTLTPDQADALARLQVFTREDGARCFVLRGYAGTGKTTLVGHYVRWLETEGVKAVLLATTGRAAKVLMEKTGMEAATIHSCIYKFDELSGLEADDQQSGQLSLQFGIREAPEYEQPVVYLVDEASMIPNTAITGSQLATFGSGHLLIDFLAFTEGQRVVFIGDPCQLPPVSEESFSPALSPRYLRDNYHVAVHYAELLQIVRQNAQSEILRLAGRFRSDILHQRYEKWPKIMAPAGKEALLHKDEQALIEKYMPHLKKKDYARAIMITNSNNHCRALNFRLRMNIHNSKDLREGELLMVVQNSYYVPLSNGDQVIVRSVEPAGHKAGFFFLKVRLQSVHNDAVHETLLIRDLLFNNYAGLLPDESRKLLIDFDIRMRKKGLKRKSMAYQEAMRTDPYLNALRAKFGYVITCHKAQGGEWPEVFLNLRKSVYVQRDNALYRWFYTALTRASERLHINDGFWVVGFNKRQPEVAIRQFKQQQSQKRKNR